jgi:hypothetical protein
MYCYKTKRINGSSFINRVPKICYKKLTVVLPSGALNRRNWWRNSRLRRRGQITRSVSTTIAFQPYNAVDLMTSLPRKYVSCCSTTTHDLPHRTRPLVHSMQLHTHNKAAVAFRYTFRYQDNPRQCLRVAKHKEPELHETWSSEGGDYDDYWRLVMWLRVVWQTFTAVSEVLDTSFFTNPEEWKSIN